jgi:hypothetical protein
MLLIEFKKVTFKKEKSIQQSLKMVRYSKTLMRKFQFFIIKKIKINKLRKSFTCKIYYILLNTKYI